MQFSNHSGRAQRGGIVYLAVDAIAPSAVQPRQNFPPAQHRRVRRAQSADRAPASGRV